MVQVAERNQLVQIFKSRIVAHKDYLMISSQEPWVNVLGNAVYLTDVHAAVLGDKACGKLDKNASQHFCVLKGTVMVKLAQSKMLCHNIKLVLFKLRQHTAAHYHRINSGKMEFNAVTETFRTDKGRIKARIVGNKHGIFTAVFNEFFQRFLLGGRTLDHFARDSRKLCYPLGDRTLGVGKAGKCVA